VTLDPPGAKPANEVTPDFLAAFSPKESSPGGTSASSVSACEPYRQWMEQGLSAGRNAKAIWQDLVTDHGYPGGYQTVKRLVRKLRGSEQPQATGIILTAPGEEAQVDYGGGPMMRDSQTGKYRRTRLFVLTNSLKRTRVAIATKNSCYKL
jgi:transposase